MLKLALKRSLPPTVIDIYRGIRLSFLRKANGLRSTKDVFTRIYKNRQWGGDFGKYCSGSGSTEHHASLYSTVIGDFIKQREISSVVDLGCGDFVVGRNILMSGVNYIGIDIVEDLIVKNQNEYGNEKVKFICLDIIDDELPNADLCLIRQVLQHLSNDQIVSILTKIHKYKYVMITEHYPAPSVIYIPNIDKPHGPDTRIHDHSAVYLDHPPFNIKNVTKILEVDVVNYIVNKGEAIITFLIEN